MLEWFEAGCYFPADLMLRRAGIDRRFTPLNEMSRLYGRVPFTPGPAPGPLLHEQVFKGPFLKKKYFKVHHNYINPIFSPQWDLRRAPLRLRHHLLNLSRIHPRQVLVLAVMATINNKPSFRFVECS